MNLLKAIANRIPAATTTNNLSVSNNTPYFPFISNLTLYPSGKDDTFINKGYNRNAWVYAIISKCAKKFSQVSWYHYRIKRDERKTWQEYVILTKDRLDRKAIIEAKKMRKKSVEQVIVDDELSKFLNKPNRNQSGAQFREQLYGFKLLTGEGNIWFSRPKTEDGKTDISQPPDEMFIIPKSCLALVHGNDPWDIREYKLLLGGQQFPNPVENILMWKFPCYLFDPVTLIHLRGQAPLDAGLLLLQSSNEGQERLAAMNKNQGVAGMVVNKGLTQPPSPEQAMFMRKQFNSIVNDRDLAGTIAYMTGDLSFLQFGMTSKELQILEQLDKTIEWFCNIYDMPPGMMTKNQTYENAKQNGRDFIFNNISVAAYGLRDELNAKLIPAFNLDRESDVIDCDVLALPELAEDLKTQAETLQKLYVLTPNQQLEYLGYDKDDDPNMNKRYFPSNLVPLEQLNQEIGSSLDNQLNLLDE